MQRLRAVGGLGWGGEAVERGTEWGESGGGGIRGCRGTGREWEDVTGSDRAKKI